MSLREQRQLAAPIRLYKRHRGEEARKALECLLADRCHEALSMLGTLYETGCGTVGADSEKAIGYYLRSIEALDDVNSHLGVSRIYLENPRLDPSRELVKYHLELLARNDVARGLYGLGLLNQHGLGVPKDQNAAIPHLQRAADKGHLGARIALFDVKGADGFLNLARLALTVIHFKILEIIRPTDSRLGLS